MTLLMDVMVSVSYISKQNWCLTAHIHRSHCFFGQSQWICCLVYLQKVLLFLSRVEKRSLRRVCQQTLSHHRLQRCHRYRAARSLDGDTNANTATEPNVAGRKGQTSFPDMQKCNVSGQSFFVTTYSSSSRCTTALVWGSGFIVLRVASVESGSETNIFEGSRLCSLQRNNFSQFRYHCTVHYA